MLKQGDSIFQSGKKSDICQFSLLSSREETAVLHCWWEHLHSLPTAALFVIAKYFKELKCLPWEAGQINHSAHMHGNITQL